jgi:hypothetical protein
MDWRKQRQMPMIGKSMNASARDTSPIDSNETLPVRLRKQGGFEIAYSRPPILVCLSIFIGCLLAYFAGRQLWMEKRNALGKPPLQDVHQIRNEAKGRQSETTPPDRTKAESNRIARAKRQDQPGSDSLDSYMESASRKMTPKIAREILARAKTEIQDPDHIAALYSRILSSLSSNGYAKEAWEMIDKQTGYTRSTQLNDFFNNLACMPYYNELTNPYERSTVIGNLMNLLPSERLSEFDFSKICVVSEREKNTISSSIAGAVRGISSIDDESNIYDFRRELTGQLLDVATTLVRDGKINATQLGRIMADDRAHDAFEDWQSTGDPANALSETQIEQLRSSVVSDMIASDAQRAIETILSDEKVRSSPLIVSRALESWFLADKKSASTWVANELPKVADSYARDVVSFSLARTAWLNGETETAVEWLGKISDPGLHAQVEKGIKSKKPDSASGK